MQRIRLSSLLAIVVIAGACASGGGSSGPRRDRNRIVLAEITELTGLTTALQVVQRLRSTWLTPRGRAGLPSVFRDDRPWGNTPQSLSAIEISSIREMQFLSATDANTRWGRNARGSVILVTTR